LPTFFVAFLALLLVAGNGAWIPGGADAQEQPRRGPRPAALAGRVVVTVAGQQDAGRAAARAEVRASRVYRFAFNGFAATLTEKQAARLANDPEVEGKAPADLAGVGTGDRGPRGGGGGARGGGGDRGGRGRDRERSGPATASRENRDPDRS